MKKILLIGAPILLTSMLVACGGGGNDSNSNISPPVGDSLSSKYDGIWSSGCLANTDGTTYRIARIFDRDNKLFSSAKAEFSDSGCGGETFVTDVITFVGFATTNGTEITSVCTADKVTFEIEEVSTAIDGSTFLSDSARTNFLSANGISNPRYDLLCLDSQNNLFDGLITSQNNGSSTAKRPDEMDLNISYNFVSEYQAKPTSNSTSSKMDNLMNAVLNGVK